MLVIAMALLAMIGLLAPPPVTTVERPGPCLGRVGGEVYCAGGRSSGRGGGYAPERRSRTYYSVPTEAGCYRIRARALRRGERRVSIAQVIAAQPSGARRCPPRGQTTNWQELVRLPKPVLTFEPRGPALAGKKVYLLIDGTDAVDVTTPEVTILAKPMEYRIDWGDGTPVTTTTDRGRGYPVGPESNTHVYQQAGEHTVVVTAMWQVTARPGAQLQQLQLETGEDATVTVTQRQAVRQS
jgi:hypothetical protein